MLYLCHHAPYGSIVRQFHGAVKVLELAGFKNIRTKSLGSNNKQNVVLATINGLSQLKTATLYNLRYTLDRNYFIFQFELTGINDCTFHVFSSLPRN